MRPRFFLPTFTTPTETPAAICARFAWIFGLDLSGTAAGGQNAARCRRSGRKQQKYSASLTSYDLLT